MKIYTSRKRNSAGQKAINCIHYSNDVIQETCRKDLRSPCICKVRLNEICKSFDGVLV